MPMAETGPVGFPWEMIQPVLHCRSSRWRPEYEYHELVNGPPLVRDEEDIDQASDRGRQITAGLEGIWRRPLANTLRISRK